MNGITAFYHLGPNGIYQPIQPVNGVIQSAVLPGFQFRVRDLKRRPEPQAMLDDPVCRNFISPFLREERIRAERAERELHAEQIRVNAINAYLKEQGIFLPDELLKQQ